MDDKKILIVIPNKDFIDDEFTDLKDFFQEEAMSVKVINTTGNISEGSGGLKVNPDFSILQTIPDDYDAIIFSGGTGVKEYSFDEAIIQMVKLAYNLKIIIGAVGKASIILCNADILKGKRATGSASVKSYFDKCGAIYTGSSVEISEKIVTALDSIHVKEFGRSIMELLKKE